jgi:hypothetical protein
VFTSKPAAGLSQNLLLVLSRAGQECLKAEMNIGNEEGKKKAPTIADGAFLIC